MINGPESAVAGHFAGFLAAFLAVVAVVLILVQPVEWFFFSGQAASRPGPALVQAVLGAVLISGVILFAQAGGVLFTSACGVIWFLLGTQKPALLERLAPSGCSWLVSACFSWLPDFTLLQIDPRTVTPGTTAATGVGPRMVYASLLVALNLTLAALLAHRTRRRSRGPA